MQAKSYCSCPAIHDAFVPDYVDIQRQEDLKGVIESFVSLADIDSETKTSMSAPNWI